MVWVAKNTSPSHVRISRNPFSAWNTHNHAFTLFISCLFDITWRREQTHISCVRFWPRPLYVLIGDTNMHSSVACRAWLFVQTYARLLAGALSRPHETRFWLGGRTRYCRIAQQWRATSTSHFLTGIGSFFSGDAVFVAKKYGHTKIFIILWEKSCNKDCSTAKLLFQWAFQSSKLRLLGLDKNENVLFARLSLESKSQCKHWTTE